MLNAQRARSNQVKEKPTKEDIPVSFCCGARLRSLPGPPATDSSSLPAEAIAFAAAGGRGRH